MSGLVHDTPLPPASKSTRTPSTAPATPISTTSDRPSPVRQGSGSADVLSYYFHDNEGVGMTSASPESATALAGLGLGTLREEPEGTPRARQQQGGSPVKSNGSVSAANGNGNGEEVKVHRRRSSKTANAGDKRRLAIVEVDRPEESTGAQSQTQAQAQTLLARRGIDTARLALVAPPDAAPLTYTDLSPAPPVSAPPVPAPRPPQPAQAHARSRSTLESSGSGSGQGRRSTSSRDIGIVGAVRSPGRTPTAAEQPRLARLDTLTPQVPESVGLGLGLPPMSASEENGTLSAPIFQIPTTRTPSPDQLSSGASSTDRLAPAPAGAWQAAAAGRLITPEIGQSKELGTAVAPPVVTLLPGSSVPQPGAYPLPAAGTQYYAAATATAATPPQAQGYYPRLPGSHINYDPVLHATAGPLPAPPRMTNLSGLAGLAPPPRPPRSTRSRSPKEGVQSEPKPAPAPAPPVPQPTPEPAPTQQYSDGPTPKATQTAFPTAPVLPLPNALVRSMSGYSLAAVSISSSGSDYEPASAGPLPGGSTPATSTSEPVERQGKDAPGPGMANYPPSAFSAFRRNSRSSQHSQRSPDKDRADRSQPSSSVKPTPEPSPPPAPPKSSEETELEAMLASMASALVRDFEPAESPERKGGPIEPPSREALGEPEPEPAPPPQPVVVHQPEPEPELEPEPESVVDPDETITEIALAESLQKLSPPLPALPLDPVEKVVTVEPERVQEQAAISLDQTPPESISPVKSIEADKQDDTSSSYESFVHASRPTTPISETTASPGKHSRRPSLTLAFATPKGSKSSTDTRSSGAERSPSLTSLGRLAGNARHQMRSPWGPAKPNPVHKAKAIAAWPAAMRFEDVQRMKTSLERAQGYARKINELAQVESGLTNWIIAIKSGPLTPDGLSTQRTPMGGNGFSGGGNRKVSAGSHTSDASFPTRPDATIATELPSNDNDSPPHGAPAGLPYPALAQGIGMRSQSTRGYNSSTLSLNITPSRSTSSGPLSAKKTTGFFSSIGRKGSTRRDRNLPLPNPNPLSRQTSSPLSAGLPGSDSPTRYVRPQVAPSIPGGPREPPNRLQKTNPVSRRSSLDSPPVIISAPLQTTTLDKRRSIGHSAVGQYARPLEAPRGARAYGSLDETSSQFSASLQKMADILPQANRMALARYLTDANGEEMMAITRYIDDEKRGGNQF